MKRFTWEFLIATAVHFVFLLWFFRGPIIHGQVDSLSQSEKPAPQSLFDLPEMAYELLPALAVQTRELKEGVFPTWDPYSQGGTPLIGKMQNGVFAPYHLLLYVLPIAWLPLVLSLVIALKSYLTFIFAYLYARSLRLNAWTGILAGSLYVLPTYGGIFSWAGTAMYLPLLLLLVECYFQGYRRFALFLWPWAMALPFLSGHFETAFWASFFAVIYLLLHLWSDKSTPAAARIGQLSDFTWLSVAAVLIAAVQIYPAWEYVTLSFNRVWHLLPSFYWWRLETISKSLSAQDAPMLLCGLAGLAAFTATFRICIRDRERLSPRTLAFMAGASTLLAWTIACFANLGFDDSLNALAFQPITGNFFSSWIMGLWLIVLAFWLLGQNGRPRGIRFLGLLMICGLSIAFKTPVIANALTHIPAIEHFHNGNLHRYEYNLGLCILSAGALEEMARMPSAWGDRLRTAIRIFGLVCVFVVGYMLSQPLKGAVSRAIPTATSPRPTLIGEAGAFMGPERITTYNDSCSVSGWLPASVSPAALRVVLWPEGSNEDTHTVVASVTPETRLLADRMYFYARIPLAGLKGRRLRVGATLVDHGAKKEISGPDLLPSVRADWHAANWLLAVLILAFPCFFLLSPLSKRAAFALAVLACMAPFRSVSTRAGRIPYSLPGIDLIKTDHELSRIASTTESFFQPDYSNLYGLYDLRTGGDNLDVLTMIYLYRDWGLMLLKTGRNLDTLELALRFWGLGNVKYVLDPPGSPPKAPWLKPVYAGADMIVWANPFFRPRATFFENYVHAPIKVEDYPNRWKGIITPVLNAVNTNGFLWDKTLIVHDLPKQTYAPSDSRSRQASVVIEENSPDLVRIAVDAPKPGLLFLADNYFPGWKALVNGQDAQILRSLITFRAVEIPAGKSQVLFEYEPVLLWGIIVLVVCFALAWAWSYCRFRRTRLSIFDPSPGPKNDSEETDACALMAERLFVVYVGAPMLFWATWAAFVLKTTPIVSWTARAVLVAFLAASTHLLLRFQPSSDR
jgi:hypothetical protein